MTLSTELQSAGIQLELLTGPLTGIYDPNGMGPCSSPCSPSPGIRHAAGAAAHHGTTAVHRHQCGQEP
ncbi:hypothetical protein [Streptomyces brasiliensis]|uniref:hypothetical protein n=1 Tax=Streptomyces brasiliensis TaxID=1954 RepID=UPI00227D8BAF|nr:hypothetical protein [Streptomyces brasiliensis]